MKNVLFLCTGNYYRSRFAEILFNDLAQNRGLVWRATSSGIAREMSRLRNPGPISQFALAALNAHHIVVEEPIRYPRKAKYEDLQAADLIIALSKKEHKPMFAQNYPGFSGTIEFWEIGDLDIETPEQALQRLEHEIFQLVDTLSNEGYRNNR